MEFEIELLERDEHYLLTCSDLTADMRGRIVQMLANHLGALDEEYLADQANRMGPNSLVVWHHLLLIDEGRLVTVRSVVDPSTAEQGVLRVMFVDTTVGLRMAPLD